MQRRYLCVWLPMFALNQYRKKQICQEHRSPTSRAPFPHPRQGEPSLNSGFALVEQAQNARRLLALDEGAKAAGLFVGMGLSDARAIMKDLCVEEADPFSDQRALIRLAYWALRWCPWVAPVDHRGQPFTPLSIPSVAQGDSYGVMLDITGSAHLFGGEAALIRDVKTRFCRAGYDTRIAIADSLGGAYALARFHKEPSLISEDLKADLAPLPVDALRLAPSMLHDLYRLGLKKIGQIASLPRPALARRFRSKSAKEGAAVAHLLTQIDHSLGRTKELLTPLVEPAELAVRLPLMDPLQHSAPLLKVLSDGLDSLLPMMEEKALGLRRLTLTAYRTDGSCAQLSASCARASLDKGHLLTLFKDRIEQIDAGFGIEIVTLAATRTAPLNPDQRSTLDTRQGDPALMDQLADRLGARLGPNSVQRLTKKASWAPERMQGFRPWLLKETDQKEREATPNLPARPPRLFPRPEPIEVLAEIPDGPPLRFRWRRRLMEITAAEGPERIAPEWWLAFSSPDPNTNSGTTPSTNPVITDEPRDYFRAEARDGNRFWLYRRGLYPHKAGLEAEGHQSPRWYIHGIFA